MPSEGAGGGATRALWVCNSVPTHMQIHLSEIWKQKYEDWLEVEVFSSPHDWDKVLQTPGAFMDIKAMEF